MWLSVNGELADSCPFGLSPVRPGDTAVPSSLDVSVTRVIWPDAPGPGVVGGSQEPTMVNGPPLNRTAVFPLLERPSRREQAERIEALGERGLDSDAIAERLGLARSIVNKYRRDPGGERERARRERHRGRCRGCGRPTRGSDGPGRGARVVRRVRAASAQTLERCADAGGDPAMDAADRCAALPLRLVAGARPGRPQRCGALPGRAGQMAESSSVARRFGSLRAAVEAGGVADTPKGR